MKNNKTCREFFEAKYQAEKDPWQFATSEYELTRYEHIYHSIQHRHYKRVFEPGCSIGVLTEKLATIADAVDAFDISPTAVELAKQRCAQLPNVTIRCDTLKHARPLPQTDLLLLSEIGYYFPASELLVLLQQLIESCSTPLTILAAHWLGYSKDHILTGDEVHAAINQVPDLQLEFSERDKYFRIDRWVKT